MPVPAPAGPVSLMLEFENTSIARFDLSYWGCTPAAGQLTPPADKLWQTWPWKNPSVVCAIALAGPAPEPVTLGCSWLETYFGYRFGLKLVADWLPGTSKPQFSWYVAEDDCHSGSPPSRAGLDSQRAGR